MQVYQPRVGELVEVSFVMEVVSLRKESPDNIELTGRIKLDESGKKGYVVGVPMVCASPFEPSRDAAVNDEVQSMGRCHSQE